MSQASATNRTSARRRLLLVAAVFAAPIVLSYVLFFSGWRPEGDSAHGELITPARPLAEMELKTLDGAAVAVSSLRARWTLVYFGSSECDSACERALYHMRQVIATQGRETHRLRAAMIVTDARTLGTLRNQLKDYPDMLALTATRENLERFTRDFELPVGGALAGLHRIYVVDPLGNLMMSYPADADPSGMRKDLARLLRYSQAG